MENEQKIQICQKYQSEIVDFIINGDPYDFDRIVLLMKMCYLARMDNEARQIFNKLVECGVLVHRAIVTENAGNDFTMHYQIRDQTGQIREIMNEFGLLRAFWSFWKVLEDYHRDINPDTSDDHRKMNWLLSGEYTRYCKDDGTPDLTQIPNDFK